MSQTKPSGLQFSQFSGAFPGQSLTTELGTYPYEKPPILPRKDQTAEDAMEEIKDNFTDKITEEENKINILSLLESGISPQLIVKQYVMSENMFGGIQTDFALTVQDELVMQVGALGEYAGIKMNLEEDKKSSINEVQLNTMIRDQNKKLDKNRFEAAVQDYEDRTSPSNPKANAKETVEDKKPSGLMSRKNDEVNDGTEDIPDVDANNEVLV